MTTETRAPALTTDELERNKDVARQVIDRIFVHQEDEAIDELISPEFQAHTGPFMGIPASGRRYSIDEIHIFRIRDGLLLEHWHAFDTATLLGQLKGDAEDRSA